MKLLWIVPKRIVDHIYRVIDYLYSSECKHWEAHTGKDIDINEPVPADNHIFYSVYILKKYFKR